MRLHRVVVAILMLAGVPLGVFLIAQVFTPGKPDSSKNVALTTGDPTSTATSESPIPVVIDIGGAIMLDPQGDVELAKRVVKQASARGTPQVVLSRKVLGGELPCLGFGGTTSIERRTTDTFGLVVLRGWMRPLFPGEPVPEPPTEPYILYLFEEQYDGITGQGPPPWGALRATFGNSAWPKDCPMYLSTSSEASVAELDAHYQWPVNDDFKMQDVHATQILNGWTVAVAQVRSRGNTIVVEYSITSPQPRVSFKVEQTLLSVNGKELRGSGIESMGTGVSGAAFEVMPEPSQPQQLSMRFMVPVIHIRPPRRPCEMPDLKPENYPTPTRIPDELPTGEGTTPLPDIGTVGPFNLDLNVVVEPMPTQPVLPTPIPTAKIVLPVPIATGKP